MLYFDEEKYDKFLNLVIVAQKDKYNMNNFFRRNNIYYRN